MFCFLLIYFMFTKLIIETFPIGQVKKTETKVDFIKVYFITLDGDGGV